MEGYCLLQKLKFLKAKHRLWDRRDAHVQEELSLLEELQHLNSLEGEDPLPPESLSRIKEIKKFLKRRAL